MKKNTAILICLLAALLLSGCGKEQTGVEFSQILSQTDTLVVGRNIKLEDVTEFIYTRETIKEKASYQQYRFYMEDGKYMFYHETRERDGGEGPTTAADIVKSGTFEITAEEWAEFFSYLESGVVKERDEAVEAESAGPWIYLYWNGDESVYQKYSFISWIESNAFTVFCSILAEEER